MKTRMLLLAMVWAAGTALAQTPSGNPPPPPNPAHQLDRLATLLDLTDAQKTQVGAVLQEEHAKMKAAFDEAKASGTKPTFEQMRATHEQMKAETIQKLTPILSDAQLKKFEVLSEEHGPHGFGPHGPPPGNSSSSSTN